MGACGARGLDRRPESLPQRKGNDMAFDLLKTVKHIEGLNNAQFRVLFYLLESANSRTFECFPSMKEIARVTRMSERTVQRHISDLADRGLFERIEQRRKDGSRAVNLYRFIVSGTVKVGNQDPIEIKAEEPIQQPANFGGLQDEQPANFDGGPPSVVTGHISGITSQESNPSLPTVEPSPRDLLGDLVPEDSRSVDLIDYVQAEWSKLAQEFPRIQNPRVLSKARKDKIRARARDVTQHAGGRLNAHDVWDQIFGAIRVSPFLRGQADPGKHHRDPFSLSIDYITRPSVFLQTLERYSIDAERNQQTHSADGRRYGPAEQAMREILASMGLDRE